MTLSEQPEPLSNERSVTSKQWPRYMLFLNGKWRWRPNKAMRDCGFVLTSFGKELTDETIARADALNEQWDRLRKTDPVTGKVRPNALAGASIYVVGFGPYIKIGYSTDMRQRIEDLECRLPEPLVIHATFPGSRKIEAALHGKYAALRLRGEWFRNEGKLAAWITTGCPFSGKTWSKIDRAANLA